MKLKLISILTLAFLVVGEVHAGDPQPISLAVFDFESKDDAVRGLGPKVATLLNAWLSAEPQFIMVERADLEKVLGEQELGLSGAISVDTAAKVGSLTGAKILVTGRVFQADDDLIIVAKIIGTETSRVYGELVKGNARSSLADLSAELAKKIAAVATEKADTLVAREETRESKIEKIKRELGDKKRPAVEVKIAEQHFGQHVIDPAAQTELMLVLQQCGFTVMDDKSTNKPDIEISGEALSEYAMRNGNLQSCRGRIEIVARQVATHEIIAVDRQTCVAVDIAEQIAAKTALQNGAVDLAGRLIPKLVK